MFARRLVGLGCVLMVVSAGCAVSLPASPGTEGGAPSSSTGSPSASVSVGSSTPVSALDSSSVPSLTPDATVAVIAPPATTSVGAGGTGAPGEVPALGMGLVQGAAPTLDASQAPMTVASPVPEPIAAPLQIEVSAPVAGPLPATELPDPDPNPDLDPARPHEPATSAVSKPATPSVPKPASTAVPKPTPVTVPKPASPAPRSTPSAGPIAAPAAPVLPALPGGPAGVPIVDVSRIPAGSGGVGQPVIIPAAVAGPNPERIGTFRFDCAYSHMNFDDPIVAPARPGASHLHTFFGNTGVTASTTTESLVSTGNSTCRGGTANRSGYWVPSMIDTATGIPIAPEYLQVYYKTGYNGVAPGNVTVIPRGLRMVVGNSRARNASSGPTTWECLDSRHGQLTASIPTNCVAGETMNMQTNFPQCWDGVNLDSPDHQSHMTQGSGGCPLSHPVAIPAVTFNVRYRVPASGTSTWRLSSDAYSASQPGGYSAHADWWNGWNENVIRTVTQNCLQRALECHMDLLGDGRALG